MCSSDLGIVGPQTLVIGEVVFEAAVDLPAVVATVRPVGCCVGTHTAPERMVTVDGIAIVVVEAVHAAAVGGGMVKLDVKAEGGLRAGIIIKGGIEGLAFGAGAFLPFATLVMDDNGPAAQVAA